MMKNGLIFIDILESVFQAVITRAGNSFSDASEAKSKQNNPRMNIHGTTNDGAFDINGGQVPAPGFNYSKSLFYIKLIGF